MKLKEIVARFTKHGKRFEILIDWKLYEKFMSGEDVDIDEIVIGDGVFKSVSTAERASEEDLKDVFHTTDIRKIYEIILRKGEVQLTQEQRQKIREEKEKQIINFIVKNAIDAQNNIPFTPSRIENALREVKFRVKELESVEKQIDEALKSLRMVVPIKFEKKKYRIICDVSVAYKLASELRRVGKVVNESWGNEYRCEVEVIGGMIDAFFNTVNRLSHGKAVVNEVK